MPDTDVGVGYSLYKMFDCQHQLMITMLLLMIFCSFVVSQTAISKTLLASTTFPARNLVESSALVVNCTSQDDTNNGDGDTITTMMSTTTTVFLVLSVPFSEVTAEVIDKLEQDCVTVYNSFSLQSPFCHPKTTLAVRCTVEEYTALGGTNNDVDAAALVDLPNAILTLEGRTSSEGNAFFNLTNIGRRRRNEGKEFVRENNAKHPWKETDLYNHRIALADNDLEAFCSCQEDKALMNSGGIDLETYMKALIQENSPLLVDGQEVNAISCPSLTVAEFHFVFEFGSEVDPFDWSPQQVAEFENLFHGECNRWSVQECDPNNFVVLEAQLDLTVDVPSEDGGSREQLNTTTALPVENNDNSPIQKVGVLLLAGLSPAGKLNPPLFASDVRRKLLDLFHKVSVLSEENKYNNNDMGHPSTLADSLDFVNLENVSTPEIKIRKLSLEEGNELLFDCYCEITRAPDNVPILQEDVTIDEVNVGLSKIFNFSVVLMEGEDDSEPTTATTSDGNTVRASHHTFIAWMVFSMLLWKVTIKFVNC